jgi:hypothetical protein
VEQIERRSVQKKSPNITQSDENIWEAVSMISPAELTVHVNEHWRNNLAPTVNQQVCSKTCFLVLRSQWHGSHIEHRSVLNSPNTK